ncbi:SRPBCC family protein [Marininema halotolerans]|uniref:Uncharacterized conserved protein YndB, AHSA1/START domain n=1 Tax=Marininema halotolerans TaxID=1155944 RepID=A0A1I6PVQ5_9BACL|nr:SRPBCC domain-containing protein [Marininema halotolerans]SFS44284.1 Uncharacterized conserved protein YndB, AHSA1/START domain [Marininema halotolerans]
MMEESKESLPEIRKSLLLNAPIQQVWEAVATAEGIAAWFMPNDFQPVMGYQFHLNAGPFGNSPCHVTELEPPHRLSFRWGKDWTITFLLEEQEAGTKFTLIHAGWNMDEVTEFGETHRVVRDRMDQGWDKLVKKLAEMVEGDA